MRLVIHVIDSGIRAFEGPLDRDGGSQAVDDLLMATKYGGERFGAFCVEKLLHNLRDGRRRCQTTVHKSGPLVLECVGSVQQNNSEVVYNMDKGDKTPSSFTHARYPGSQV